MNTTAPKKSFITIPKYIVHFYLLFPLFPNFINHVHIDIDHKRNIYVLHYKPGEDKKGKLI